MEFDVEKFDKLAEHLLAVTGGDLVSLSPDFIKMVGFDPDDVRKHSRMVLPVTLQEDKRKDDPSTVNNI